MNAPLQPQIDPDVLDAAGAWAVGVSGGADSVALLLLLLRDRPHLTLRVVHLDHELRGEASAGDASFVQSLAGSLGLPCDVARRSELEPAMGADPLANSSARYRACRLAWFRGVVVSHGLSGVVLAHHADDVAETVLQRLLRGSGPAGLAGIASVATVGGLRIVRPLLGVHRDALREFLHIRGQSWREDASNTSDDYLRNRLRKLLSKRPGLATALLKLAHACKEVRDWARSAAPVLPDEFPVAALRAAPSTLAREAARGWLIAAGAPSAELSGAVLDRLVAMAVDAATPCRQQFPGGLSVRRRGGRMWSDGKVVVNSEGCEVAKKTGGQNRGKA